MRSTLSKFDGCEALELEAGKMPFKLRYDPSKAELTKIMDALAAAGETVSKVE